MGHSSHLVPVTQSAMTISKTLVLVLDFGCEAFLYGCYTVLFAISIYLMFYSPRRGTSVNKPIFIISGLLYLSCSAHFALVFSDFYRVIVVNDIANENVAIVIDLLVSVTDFIGELILIYRCWLLWSRNYWVIVLPGVILIASIVCVGVLVVHLMLQNPSIAATPSRGLESFGLATLSLPLGTNVIVTALIAGRIWYLSPRKPRNICSALWQFPTRIGHATIDIVIESGMLYLAVQLILVILVAIQHPAQSIASVIAVQIYGIAATLTIIRARLCISNMRSEVICSGLPSSMHFTIPTLSTQVRTNTEPGRRLPAEMSLSEIIIKPISPTTGSEDLGAPSSSMERVTAVAV